MASNIKYKRDAISLMRDGIKSQYKKDSQCAICGCAEELELHHYHTVSLLVKKFAKELQLDFTDEEIVLSNRTAFYDRYRHELVEDTVTLCVHHHQLLHKVYTKEPPLFSANKQKVWVQKQKDKLQNPQEKTQVKTETKSGFARFL
ncbi:hypothetical protein JM746_000062 [Shigella sonnei]|uniref:Nicking endonuclease n=5 Tax=Tequintavirus TaxID=187218 RepID=A0AAE7VQ18_9CAUD|nr:putative nicking site-specific endonuclease [Salmonella phage oldekolle]EBS4928546.1 hypothetical protein [Salmonella enterica subsp. enterica serovar Bareilly]EBX4970996.1 hypothetical protein [Salmonella enterica subsp. enterica serovar Thompson]EFQ1274435.1 hypothetical protein [Shigella flexneri]EHE3968303.1 hypothetical protein [Shigella sonnei]MDW6844726.1 hypothetical protein [Escherichia coli]QXV77209.1 nicking endonuclease [Escherichia phage DaisyDussoix]QYC97280.1 hypothetical p